MPHLTTAFACRLILSLIGMLCCVPAGGAETRTLFSEDFEKPIGDRWHQVKFGDPTDYRVVTVDSNACLQATANGTASAFAVKLDIPPASEMTLRWRWKISGCPTNGTDDRAATFDHTGRIFVAFDTLIGPPRTINYVWANRAGLESTFDHPHTSRSRFIVIERGDEKAGRWLGERRDLRKDWERLFKGQSMPKIVGIGVFTDSDGTRVPVTGWYGDIRLEGR